MSLYHRLKEKSAWIVENAETLKLTDEQKKLAQQVDEAAEKNVEKADGNKEIIDKQKNENAPKETYSISGIIIKPIDKTNGSNGSTGTPTDNPNAYNPGAVEVSSQLVNVGSIIVGSLKYIGIIASVIMIMVIGIKYIIGSTSEKAEYKKIMIPYIIGIILLSSGGFLIEILYKLVAGTGINN